MIRIVTPTFNMINSNLLKKLLPNIEKKKEDGLNNAEPRNKINMGAWNEISC